MYSFVLNNLRVTYSQVMKLYSQIFLHITPKYIDVLLHEHSVMTIFRKFDTDALLFSNIKFLIKSLQLLL